MFPIWEWGYAIRYHKFYVFQTEFLLVLLIYGVFTVYVYPKIMQKNWEWVFATRGFKFILEELISN